MTGFYYVEVVERLLDKVTVGASHPNLVPASVVVTLA